MKTTILSGLLVSFGCLGGTLAKADDFKPVIVIGQNGHAPEEVQAAILETVTAATQQGSMTSLANELYGSGAAFKKRDAGGALAALGKGIMEIDRTLDEDLKALNRRLGPKLQGADWTFFTRMTWTDDQKLPPMKDKLLGHQYAFLWSLGEMGMRQALKDKNQEGLAKSLTQATNITVVDAASLSDGGQNILNQGRRIEKWLADGSQDQWLPLYAAIEIHVSNGIIVFYADVVLKPAQMMLTLDDPQAQSLEYRPVYFGDTQNVARMGLTRTYGGNRDDKPTMTVTFGEMVTNDVRAVGFCLNHCAEALFQVPTIRIRMAPDTVAKGRYQAAVDKAKKTLANYVDVFIMIKQLGIDLSNPDGPMVMPEKSQMALLVRRKGWTGKVTTTVIDSSQEVYGINLYQRIVGGSLESSITAQARQGMSDLDKESNDSLSKNLQQLTGIFTKK